MIARSLKSKRAAAGISGSAVCQRAGISRAKLSDIECENILVTTEELQRIDAAIDGIIEARRQLIKFANDSGLDLAGVRL